MCVFGNSVVALLVATIHFLFRSTERYPIIAERTESPIPVLCDTLVTHDSRSRRRHDGLFQARDLRSHHIHVPLDTNITAEPIIWELVDVRHLINLKVR